MEQKLDIVEEAKVEYFINAYKELHQALDLVTSDINKLNEEKEKIIAKVNAVRSQDAEFLSSLEAKYGEGKIDPKTMTYTITK
jgi:archaellum component FlaC